MAKKGISREWLDKLYERKNASDEKIRGLADELNTKRAELSDLKRDIERAIEDGDAAKADRLSERAYKCQIQLEARERIATRVSGESEFTEKELCEAWNRHAAETSPLIEQTVADAWSKAAEALEAYKALKGLLWTEYEMRHQFTQLRSDLAFDRYGDRRLIDLPEVPRESFPDWIRAQMITREIREE